MKTVLLLSGHYYNSRRRAGFHHIADSFYKKGYRVIFATVNISYINLLRKNYRFEYPIKKEKNRLIEVRKNFYSYIYFTGVHQLSINSLFARALNTLFSRYYRYFPLKGFKNIVKQADLIIFESTPAIVLLDCVKKINKDARVIYRVSDDLELLNAPSYAVNYEKSHAEQFDLISIPSDYIYQKFPVTSKRLLQYHAINKDMYDAVTTNPYNSNINIVFVGNSRLDNLTLETMAENFPDAIFHIIGPVNTKLPNTNICYYGEMPFADTIPYVKFADIGLVIKGYEPGAESYTDCLKVIQYTYAGIALVVPDFIKSARVNTFSYLPGNRDSITNSINNALSANRNTFKNLQDSVEDWDSFTEVLIHG